MSLIVPHAIPLSGRVGSGWLERLRSTRLSERVLYHRSDEKKKATSTRARSTRVDPAAALLARLTPEQRRAFLGGGS